MHIAVVGLSHRTAPVEVRERLSIPEQSMEVSLARLRSDDQVLEASILSTCNRLEIYTLLRHPDLGIESVAAFLAQVSGLSNEQLRPHLFTYHHEEAISHLLRVAAGLDSLVLGEGQILAQVKKMVRLGQEYRSVGPILNRLLTQAEYWQTGANRNQPWYRSCFDQLGGCGTCPTQVGPGPWHC